ncbi:hypothetical protein BJY00DRAFT_187454 [Aspergillus carlsbadensis]|nr:hypothetical protein BJY00DRAFT_187454 [Aspergillus carlsbadensis]
MSRATFCPVVALARLPCSSHLIIFHSGLYSREPRIKSYQQNAWAIKCHGASFEPLYAAAYENLKYESSRRRWYKQQPRLPRNAQ